MKTPKEKAKELVEKYKPFCKDTKHTGIIDGIATCMNDEVLNHNAISFRLKNVFRKMFIKT